MKVEKNTHIVDALLYEYTKILRDMFPGVMTLKEFADAFNDVVFTYQRLSLYQFDPKAIREKQVRCATAALLMGLMLKLTQHEQATYHVEMVIDPSAASRGDTHTGKSVWQANAHIMLQESKSTPPFWEMWNQTRRGMTCVVSSAQQRAGSNPWMSFHDTRAFFANRLGVLGLHEAARSQAERISGTLPPRRESDQEYFAFLRGVLDGDKR